jgi:hypothetical protein
MRAMSLNTALTSSSIEAISGFSPLRNCVKHYLLQHPRLTVPRPTNPQNQRALPDENLAVRLGPRKLKTGFFLRTQKHFLLRSFGQSFCRNDSLFVRRLEVLVPRNLIAVDDRRAHRIQHR